MSTTDATGPALNDGNIVAATASKLTDPADLELQEGRRQKELRDQRLYGPAKKRTGGDAGNVLPFGPTGNAGMTGNTACRAAATAGGQLGTLCRAAATARARLGMLCRVATAAQARRETLGRPGTLGKKARRETLG